MPKIYVNREFTLQLGGEKRLFTVGNHSVDAETAKHWYVLAHIGDEPAVDPDTSAAADALLAELDARAHKLQKLEDQVAEREKAAAARETELAQREDAVAEREKAADNADQAAAGKAKPTK
ncbi:hypothetical protein KDH83_13425 [Achromobacter sp. Marseille-Q0513]|uniref:STY1053 family phage-associated protein n=1 Tax=Achromobacter sp. Marseille-Q0513 TaxID=2829161 RepID=UPI001B9E5477|nr:hypothetical protein [Achromobacter sp. Marseille-Q0513]MBR8654297.1 hypothetical protein [Achromobacter sp. Marseille-Q0513]